MSSKSTVSDPLTEGLLRITANLPAEIDGTDNWMTIAEKNMIMASAAIRSENGWVDKLNNQDAIKCWSEMAKSKYGLDESAIEYMLLELNYYAKVSSAHSDCKDCKPAVVDMVWTAKMPQNDSLLVQLKESVAQPLENMPKSQQNWRMFCYTKPRDRAQSMRKRRNKNKNKK
ncbi:hypothetical protein LPJ75_002271, partial [Coemansia sp. RSA 2598]